MSYKAQITERGNKQQKKASSRRKRAFTRSQFALDPRDTQALYVDSIPKHRTKTPRRPKPFKEWRKDKSTMKRVPQDYRFINHYHRHKLKIDHQRKFNEMDQFVFDNL